MSDLTTPQSRQFSGSSALTIELAKMLALVAPSSMTTEQQELWLRAAVDALQDIRPQEVATVSAEVRRTVTRHNQIVPEIAKLVAERRERSNRYSDIRPVSLTPELPKPPAPPISADEIRRMPKWLRDTGLRVGFLKYDGGQIVDSASG